MFLGLILAVAMPAAAQAAGSPPLAATSEPALAPATKHRIDELLAILSDSGDYDGYFAPRFKTEVPKTKLDTVLAQLTSSAGKPVRIASITPKGPWAADVNIDYERATVAVQIYVDPAEPHQVSGLLVTGFTAAAATPDEAVAAIAALPGKTSFAFLKLGAGSPILLKGSQPDRALAIGSAFKLVVLSELVRGINAGERRWTDTVTIDGRPLPGGGYTQKPVGTTVTLRELATRMIQVSDNSATDLLIRALGRRKIEAMLPVVGIADPARNRPFLATLDMFTLKATAGGALARRYLSLDEAGRRAMLDGEVAATPISALDPKVFSSGKPVLIDQLEWFESANDIGRVYDWLRKASEPGMPGAPAREILPISPGLPANIVAKWAYVGFKGGSEPGVLATTYLLRAKTGDWYVAAASWNNDAAPVETGTLVGLMARFIDLSAP